MRSPCHLPVQAVRACTLNECAAGACAGGVGETAAAENGGRHRRGRLARRGVRRHGHAHPICSSQRGMRAVEGRHAVQRPRAAGA